MCLCVFFKCGVCDDCVVGMLEMRLHESLVCVCVCVLGELCVFWGALVALHCVTKVLYFFFFYHCAICSHVKRRSLPAYNYQHFADIYILSANRKQHRKR